MNVIGPGLGLGRSLVIPLALLLDLLVGDPPNRFHPVAWMGTVLARAQRYAPRQGRSAPLAYGAGVVLGGACAIAGLGHLSTRLPWGLGLFLEAILLKTTLALRGLERAGSKVAGALQEGDLPKARRLVSWHLVSRDTTTRDASQVAAATIESIAENASDGVLAPLFHYAWGGLPAALAYRFINTADAMWGYRDAAREWLGKVPARLDDLANLVPARLTAILLLAASAITGGHTGRAWYIWRRDAGKTVSPNAGHPMSAMAGALGVELEKSGHYRLGEGQRRPTTEDIPSAIRLMRLACGLGAALLVATPLFVRACRREHAR